MPCPGTGVVGYGGFIEFGSQCAVVVVVTSSSMDGTGRVVRLQA
jgi:hypothetical protein